jgi:hypothetical protein
MTMAFAVLVLGCGASRGDTPSTAPRAASAGVAPRPARGEPPALTSLVGDESVAAFEARIDSLVRSPYFTGLADAMRNDPDPSARLEAEWLLDLLGRSRSLVGASFARGDGTLSNLYMLRGQYTPADVRHMVEAEEGVAEEQRGDALIFRRADRAVALIGDHTIAVGDVDRIAGVLGRVERPVPPEEASGAVAGLEGHPSLGRDDMALFLVVGPEIRRFFDDAGMGNELQDVRTIALGMTLSDGVETRIEASTATPEEAARVQRLVDAQLVMLSETALAHVLGLGEALRRTRTAVDGTQVTAFTYVDDATLKHAIEAGRALGLSLQVETAPPEGMEPDGVQPDVPSGPLPPNTD